MPISKFLIAILLFFTLWVYSSIATANESTERWKTQDQKFESSTGLILMAEDTVLQDPPEASPSDTSTDLERAFKEYFTRPWSVMLYQGFATSTDLGQTLVFDIQFEDAYFTGLVANRKMFPFWRYFTFELEGQVLKHYGRERHWEFDGLFLIRYHPFLLSSTVDVEFAAGWGLSYATRTPVIEEEQHPEATSRLLNYLTFEFAFTHAQYREWSLVTRIHHRSGIFGLFNGTSGGSNYLALGLRHHF